MLAFLRLFQFDQFVSINSCFSDSSNAEQYRSSQRCYGLLLLLLLLYHSGPQTIVFAHAATYCAAMYDK